MKTRILPLAVLSFAAAMAHANLLTNGSFEDGAFVGNGDNTMVLHPGDTTMTGWTVSSSDVAWITDPNPFGGTASDGKRFLDLTSYGGDAGGVKQSFSTIVGNAYTVEFDLGSYSRYGDAFLRTSAGGVSQDWTFVNQATPAWVHKTWSFTAVATTSTLELGHYFGNGDYTGLDNVSVTAGVPEPATMALLALAPLALRRRRK